MHLTGLHLLLTYRCTYECDHCFVYSSPEAEGTMTLHLAKDAVRQAAELGTVEEVWLEGGEPFLYFPILREVVRYASSLKLETGIVTNAYFAETMDDALVWLTPLRDAGLTRLSISDDDFHSEKFPHSPVVRNIREAAQRLGLVADTICMERAGSAGSVNAKGEPITGGTIRFRGRAVETMSSEAGTLEPWCTFHECPDEDWDDVGRLHLDPYGNLFSCQGIVFGNLHRQSLADVVKTYAPQNHPIIGPLRQGGPAELVDTFDLALRLEFHDACHLCYTARQQLIDRFPQELAPRQVYGIK